MLNRVERALGQPLVESFECLFAGEDFVPVNLPCAAVSLLDRGVENALGSAPDVRACAVAFDEGDDRIVRNLKLTVPHLDRASVGRCRESIKCGHKSESPRVQDEASTLRGAVIVAGHNCISPVRPDLYYRFSADLSGRQP